MNERSYRRAAVTTPARSTSALRLIVPTGDSPAYEELVEQGLQAEREGHRVRARELWHRALASLPSPKAREASALMRWIGRTHQTDGDGDTALECLTTALEIATEHGDLAATGHAINLQAIVHWQSGRMDEAEVLFNSARDNAVAAGEARLAAMTAQNLGVIANIRGDLELALHHFETGLRDYRALGLPADVCKTLNNLGLLQTGQQRWSAAAAAYQEALTIAEILGDVSSRIMIEVNYAEHFLAQGNFERARVVADLASSLAARANDARAEGDLHKVYGIIARESGDLASAEEHLRKAQEIAERRGDLLLLAEATKAKADLHRKQGRNRDTLHCLNAAHRIFSQLRARRELADIDSRMTQLEGDFLEVVRKWSESIESKDHYTQGHCERVADLACALAARAGLDAQSLFWFRIGAMLHDVGKLVIASDVLNKPGPLTPIEWELVKQHPVHGVEMLADVDFPWDVRPIVESHHERWDGEGYPHGLVGEEIPLTARILCIADVYDALTSQRSYKRPLSHQEALDVMRHDVGHQFDPALFPAFEEISGELARTRGGVRAPVTRPRLDGVGGGAEADELTGLPLRRAFLERARTELRSRPSGVSLLVIDVDHFKLINDTYGHLAGDQVLRELAAVLRRNIRSSDFLGRYAGDEFVALLSNTRPEEAMIVADSLRRAVHGLAMSPPSDRRSAMSTTISVGVAVAPDNGATIEELFESADRALYEAKLEGRDIAVSAGQSRTAGRDQPLMQERFVGRVQERRRLTQLLDESVHSGARLVAVVGEAGIGKSALARELASEIRMRAGSLVLGRCVDAEARAPLAPWTAVLQAIRVLRVVVDRPWRQLPRLLSDAGAAAPPSADGTRFALFEEVAEYLTLAAAARPLVIVIDDMQWADETSWNLLEHVMTRVARDRILFCVTIREEDNGTASTDALARLSRDERFSMLRLARMSAVEQHDWLRQVLSSPADETLVKYLYRHSEGNPFFSVQMLRSLVDEHRLRWTGRRWEWTTPSEGMLPVAVSDLLTRRVNRLSPQARGILSAAATLGRAIDVEVVVRAGIGSDEEVLDAIDEGITRSVLDVSDVHGESHIAFAHALLVDIMCDTLNPERRKRLHQRVAEAMEELRPTHAAALAHHYEVAGVQEKAFAHAREAAERAASVFAHDEAISQLIAAERHASSTALLADARIRRAAITESAGRYPEAETIYGSVITDCAGAMSVAQRAVVRRAVTRLRSLQGEAVDVTRVSCRQLLVEAEALGLDDERAALLMTLSQSHSRTGETDVAESLARECLAITERRDDLWPQAEARLRLGSSILQERPSEAMVHFGRALALCESLDHTIGQIRCHINLGVGHTYLGALDDAESAYRNALARGREVHSPDFAGVAALNLGALFMKRGRMADARAQLEEANELFETVGNEPHRVAALFNLAHLSRQEGRRDDAMRLYGEVSTLARALGLHDVVAGASAGIGLMALDAGEEDAAAASWRSVLAVLRVLGHAWFQGRELVEALGVRMALRDGDGPRAQRYFESGVDLGSAHDAYGVAWLVATCAPLLADGSAPVCRSVIRDMATEYADRAERMGAEPLSVRFAELLNHGRLAATLNDVAPNLMAG